MFQTGVWIRSNWISDGAEGGNGSPVFILRHFLATIGTEGIKALFINLKLLIYDKRTRTLLNPSCDIRNKCLVHLVLCEGEFVLIKEIFPFFT